MQDAEKKLEYEALVKFAELMDTDGSLGAHVRRVITEELTARQAELIRLYYFEQKNMNEIACLLGLSPSSVSRTIKRGKTRIRKYFKYNGRALAHSIMD